ncbi:DUF4435 domain-containing protein [Nostoc sp. ChiSLP03a]|uniref:DUF4435 domain-containing protein n=1 Tax=Nostoc sp. ChiSLP03a TaxID=3075380 RepID=UPI002AD3E280|nr:DUF4435 domain-containing protein [Nostoc sp. ChiSLP03a]MDZ8211374.1 DUF4435 domain-containing protein [Nostoc sp. ChiSLP03a]
MREFLTVDRVANKIRQLRQTYSGAFLLVEGSSDKVFYERFVDKKLCHLEITAGKPSSKQCAIEILAILETSNFQGILAIVDADFDHLQNTPVTIPNLLRTDTHDLETMLINSLAFDKVITLFGSEEKIIKFGRDLRSALLESGMSVGYLVWVSQSDGLNLKFDGIEFSKFVDSQTLKINELKLITEVINKSQAYSLTNEDIQKRLTNKKSSSHDPWQVCRGHDLVEILSIGLRKAIGSNPAIDVKPNSDDSKNTLEGILLLAYEEIYFYETQLYSEIRLWETNNPPFQVLRNNA